MAEKLKGVYALVTGSSGGIGFEIARGLLSEGAFVGAHYYGNRKIAERLSKNARHGRCRLFQADFSSSDEVIRMWDEFIAWSKGRIGILVNNAGEVLERVAMDRITEDIWDRTFQINLKAPFLLSRAALAVMAKRRRGRIINISSIGVKFGGSFYTAHYSASKAALEAVSRSFAKAGAPFNVLVTVVRAGLTDTPLHRKTGRKDLAARIRMVPLERMAAPREISNVVVFLAGEKGSFVTNTVIDVAGGE